MGDTNTTALIAERNSSPELVQYLKRIQSVIWNRKIFKVGENLVGIAPGRAFSEDIVCILWGCDVPVVLRKVKKDGEGMTYELVGECYIHDMMDGRAVEGVHFAMKCGL